MNSTDSLIMVQSLRTEVVVTCEDGVVCKVVNDVSLVRALAVVMNVVRSD